MEIELPIALKPLARPYSAACKPDRAAAESAGVEVEAIEWVAGLGGASGVVAVDRVVADVAVEIRVAGVEADWVLAQPTLRPRVVPALALLLQAGGSVTLLAGVAKELLDRRSVESLLADDPKTYILTLCHSLTCPYSSLCVDEYFFKSIFTPRIRYLRNTGLTGFGQDSLYADALQCRNVADRRALNTLSETTSRCFSESAKSSFPAVPLILSQANSGNFRFG